ncbi:unnamed protein product [Paramecium sonneborni]|uniref:Uncharacterized protein n=1 Tax=Paramecium sonneborni TaxID=65129 RepID=A0A8S1QTZ4_9CILI|nr:unnamed protein product [Paramecium sonneborni]
MIEIVKDYNMMREIREMTRESVIEDIEERIGINNQ